MDTEVYADATRELSDRFGDLVSSLSALRELSQLNAQTTDEGSLVRHALEGLIRNQDFLRCSVFVLQGDQLINRTGLDVDDLYGDQATTRKPQSTRRFRLGEGMIGMAAESGEIQRCSDCRNDTRFVGSQREQDKSSPGSLICVPLTHGGEVLGVLNVSHPQPQHFTDWHERLLSVYCSVLAMLITNSRLLNRLETHIRRRTRDLETALAEATRMKQEFSTQDSLDPHSGLYTETGFRQQADIMLERAYRHRQTLWLASINLKLQGSATNQRNTAKRLGECLRAGDIAGVSGDSAFLVMGLGIGSTQLARYRQALDGAIGQNNYALACIQAKDEADLNELTAKAVEQSRH
ncbi:MAG: GAF domain-containing protein [Chromatiales bacterium]|nr:GAF domain-containing protein [Chromatiales bacterium]